jgi:hypothetical protein
MINIVGDTDGNDCASSRHGKREKSRERNFIVKGEMRKEK